MRAFGWLFVLTCGTLAAQVAVPGDAQKGKQVFTAQNCIACHTVNGEGGKLAPDLGKPIGRDYTPFEMTALMWNHAPTMWASMEKQGIPQPKLTEAQAADLFAFFYSARYFERPGDAARGKRVFEGKGCSGCHGLASSIRPDARAVSEWPSLKDPIALAQQMWNHSSAMSAAMSKKGLARPVLTSQEITDLLVYLQNLPQTRQRPAEFSPASAQTGEELFRVKGCAGCHQGRLSLQGRRTGRTLTDLAADMWNHAPKMGNSVQPVSYEEMRRLVGYFWSLGFFETRGNPQRGRSIFARKNCATCHSHAGTGAPNLSSVAGKMNPFAMIDVLWLHGPVMLERMRQKNIAWPRFTTREMADLTAYLDQGRAAAGTPSPKDRKASDISRAAEPARPGSARSAASRKRSAVRTAFRTAATREPSSRGLPDMHKRTSPAIDTPLPEFL